MAKKAFQTSEEAVNLYDELYQSRVDERGADYTHGAFFQELVEHYQQSKDEAVVFAELRTELDEAREKLAKVSETHELNESVFDNYKKVAEPFLEMLSDRGIDSIEQLEEHFNAEPQVKERTIEVPAALSENQLLLTIPEPTLSILSEVCRRLSEKFGREVSPADVLIDGFIKYNVEQYREWFYPLTISEGEFFDICGYNHEQLLKWIRGGK